MDLAKALRVKMAQENTKSKVLAAEMGVLKQTVTNWRQVGNMNQHHLERICDYYNMPVSEFVKLGEKS